METFWSFRLRFRRAYDSAYDSDIRFSLGHKLSYDSECDSDSVASENQPLLLHLDPREKISSPIQDLFCLTQAINGYRTALTYPGSASV